MSQLNGTDSGHTLSKSESHNNNNHNHNNNDDSGDLEMSNQNKGFSINSQLQSNGKASHIDNSLRNQEELDYSLPITTTYLKRMKSLGLTATDINPDSNYVVGDGQDYDGRPSFKLIVNSPEQETDEVCICCD